MSKFLFHFGAVAICFATLVGCGPNNEVTVPEVDDSVVHSEEEMEALAESNAADMMSK